MSGSITGGVKGKGLGNGAREYLWPSLTHAETPEAAFIMMGGDVTVQFNFESGTPTLELHGTNLIDGNGLPTGFSAMPDIDGNAIAINATGWRLVKPAPRFMKPVYASGTGTVTVVLTVRSAR